MSNRSRMPNNFDEFNTYLGQGVTYLQAGTPTTNAERLGIDTTEVTDLNSYYTDWKPVYSLYSDKKNSRTTSVIEQLRIIQDNVFDYDHTQHILDRIAASPNATVTDLTTFNIKSGLLAKTTRTKPTTPISEVVSATIKQQGGGILAIKCRDEASGTAAIVEEANCVEYMYKIGTEAPASVKADGLKNGLSTRASFTLSVGAENSAKNIYIYFRWLNTKYPALAGPWSSLQTCVIV